MDHGAIACERSGGRQIAGPPQAGHVEPLDERGIARRIEIADVEYRSPPRFDRQRKQASQRGIACAHEHRIRCRAQRLRRCPPPAGLQLSGCRCRTSESSLPPPRRTA